MFRLMADEELPEEVLKHKKKTGDKLNCKNIFAQANPTAHTWDKIAVCIRYRYEKVSRCLKAMKPYVVTTSAVKLTPGKPLEVHHTPCHVDCKPQCEPQPDFTPHTIFGGFTNLRKIIRKYWN